MNPQTVAAIIIVLAAVVYALYRVLRTLRSPEDFECTPEKCKSCPYAGTTSCPDPDEKGN
jgi:hypothetical protein